MVLRLQQRWFQLGVPMKTACARQHPLRSDRRTITSRVRIERIDIETGKVETLYDNCNGNRLSGNDIVFDRKGNMWFTDLGKARARDPDRGAIYWAKPDGSAIKEVIQPLRRRTVSVSPDEKTLYVAETEGGRLFAYDIVGDGEVALLPYPKSLNGGRYVTSDTGMRRFDSLAVEDCGNVCVATLFTGGITVASPDGGTAEFVETGDGYTTNICFGGENLAQKAYITLSWQGLLVECDWPRSRLGAQFFE